MSERCFWCDKDPDEAAARHEGPHATWCVHFRENQRGGRSADRLPSFIDYTPFPPRTRPIIGMGPEDLGTKKEAP